MSRRVSAAPMPIKWRFSGTALLDGRYLVISVAIVCGTAAGGCAVGSDPCVEPAVGRCCRDCLFVAQARLAGSPPVNLHKSVKRIELYQNPGASIPAIRSGFRISWFRIHSSAETDSSRPNSPPMSLPRVRRADAL